MPEINVYLRKPLERSIRSGHPWIYRDALQAFAAEPGTVVRVLDKAGRYLARGLAEAGAIAVRVFTTANEPVDDALLQRRIVDAFSMRVRFVPEATNAYRLLHGEGDRLPGVVCDRYAGVAVLRLDGEAAVAWQDRIADCLRAPLTALGIDSLLVRSGSVQEKPVSVCWGPPPPNEVVVQEHGMRLCASLLHGQKTGLFLDHRESRKRIRALSAGLSVLNLYSYTGGFSVAAALGAAKEIVSVDSSEQALVHATHSFTENDLPAEHHSTLARDVPALLTELSAERRRFDLVIADPPNFAPNAASKSAALDAYAALHRGVLAVLSQGGYYLAASCSSHVTHTDFEATLREGARRARRSLQVLERWTAPADHPRLLAFPEGDYLKVTLLRSD